MLASVTYMMRVNSRLGWAGLGKARLGRARQGMDKYSWDKILQKRTSGLCEICKLNPATERNHCIIHRSKGYKKYLDVPENIEFVCHSCHYYPAHTSENKISFWARQEKRGYDMDAWWNSLPWELIIGRPKPNFYINGPNKIKEIY
jgi:hypothetical protein